MFGGFYKMNSGTKFFLRALSRMKIFVDLNAIFRGQKTIFYA